MDNRRISAISNAPSMSSSVSNIKNSINSRVTKEKMSPALKRALSRLHLADLSALEHHFLATVAFLKPWSQFRDCFLLLQPGSAPRASAPGRVRSADILWFYTNFSDGELRYDPRADDTTSLYTTDESKYGSFDTTLWGVEEHEKMLYAWLLQEFKVGKARNPFGFEFFQCLNVCTAWRECFIPIVEAVRESYDYRGRRYYGRLAKFVEEKHPSRVAFPLGNLATPKTPSPYRVISYGGRDRSAAVTDDHLAGSLSLTGAQGTKLGARTQEKDLEKELRNIESKYGQVVEKPKWRPAEFFATQKARMKQKNLELQEAKGALFGHRRSSGRESPMFGCIGVDDPQVLDPMYNRRLRAGSSTADMSPLMKSSSSGTVVKHNIKKDRGVVPVGMYGFAPAPNPLHGVTRPFELSDQDSEGETEEMATHLAGTRRDHLDSAAQASRPGPSFARPQVERKDSDSVYSEVRNSNPFIDEGSTLNATPENPKPFDVLSPMYGHPSAIPKALFDSKKRGKEEDLHASPSPKPTPGSESHPSRMPSYAGTGYDRSPSPTFIASKLHSTLERNAFDQASSREPSSFLLSEIPEACTPPHQTSGSPIPTAIPWPGFTPALSPDSFTWPGRSPTDASPAVSPAPTEWPLRSAFESHTPEKPPIPPRHPARAGSIRSSDSTSSLAPPPPIPGLLGPRIVSKENIRGHLRDISRDISDESLDAVRGAGTSAPRLVPFNKNMFPRGRDRKGTPVGRWMGNMDEAGESKDGYEMATLKEEGSK